MAGSSGGGSTQSGIPEYLSGNHILWLNHNVPDIPDYSMVDLMNSAWAIGGNPWDAVGIYNPAVDLNYLKQQGSDSIGIMDDLSDILLLMCEANCEASEDVVDLRDCIDSVIPHLDNIDAILSAIDDQINDLDHLVDWQVAINTARTVIDGTIITDAFLNADIQSFSDIYDDNIETNVLPKFRAGLRNVNAVHSSAFVIGEALIWAFRDRDVAKYASGLRLDMHSQRNRMIMESVELMLRNLHEKISFMIKLADINMQGVKTRVALCDLRAQLIKVRNQANLYSAELVKTHLMVANGQMEARKFLADLYRVHILSTAEHFNTIATYEDNKARWPFEVYQHGSNLLAAVSGGTVPVPHGPTRFQNALGGALSGGALGGMVSDSYGGIGIGAIVGALGSMI